MGIYDGNECSTHQWLTLSHCEIALGARQTSPRGPRSRRPSVSTVMFFPRLIPGLSRRAKASMAASRVLRIQGFIQVLVGASEIARGHVLGLVAAGQHDDAEFRMDRPQSGGQAEAILAGQSKRGEIA